MEIYWLDYLLKKNVYPKEEDFSKALIKNNCMDFSFSKSECGENWFYTYHIVLPDNKVLKDPEYDFKTTIFFLLNSIYKPYRLGTSFYEEEFLHAKEKLKIFIEQNLANSNYYAQLELEKAIDTDNYFEDSIPFHIKDLDGISNQELYSYFKKNILDKKPFIFVAGDVSKSFIKTLDNAFFKDLKPVKYIPYHVKPFLTCHQENWVNEKKEYNQSFVKFAYKVMDFQKEDLIYFTLLRFLFSSQSSNILMDYLRARENLVYVARSFYNSYHGVFFITAQIAKGKHIQTIKTIKEVFTLLKEESFILERLENIKNRKKINLERQKDSLSSLFSDFQFSFFKTFYPLPEEYEKIKNITAKDIALFVKRLSLDTIYYLEGTKNEE